MTLDVPPDVELDTRSLIPPEAAGAVVVDAVAVPIEITELLDLAPGTSPEVAAERVRELRNGNDAAQVTELRDEVVRQRQTARAEPNRIRSERRRIRTVVIDEIDRLIQLQLFARRSGGKEMNGVTLLETLKARLTDLHRSDDAAAAAQESTHAPRRMDAAERITTSESSRPADE